MRKEILDATDQTAQGHEEEKGEGREGRHGALTKESSEKLKDHKNMISVAIV